MTLKDSTVLITGGTGSFGSRVARHLIDKEPGQIRIFSRDEKKQWEMRRQYPEFLYMLGDVRDASRLLVAMEGVDHVFHAAALKQVGSCEQYPFEAVQTNVIGSNQACLAAKAAGVKTFVALSTDKAVKPVNAMGVSKAMMEKIICSQNQYGGRTVFCCVRYGNVMGSRGSVIPLFQEQLAQKQPLTVTVPEMTRFLMTLDDSVDLVFHAMTHAEGGEVFVRKAPACTIMDLAETLRFRAGMPKHPIHLSGIRPGEKIHEILVNEYEMQRVSEAPDYFTIHPEYRVPSGLTTKVLGDEFTSFNTRQLKPGPQIDELLDAMGVQESFH
ncbi:MAG: polysaccharide biosynthesis protein [Verrucomicrobiota bacterium]|jgi:UDP-N-acetylglucosamine 4,6-dehydratase/5-epimerase|nr:polysaccharide biosynthesis protein [Verrucomicrobiota bacterium]